MERAARLRAGIALGLQVLLASLMIPRRTALA
jgi:hypothetical protein